MRSRLLLGGPWGSRRGSTPRGRAGGSCPAGLEQRLPAGRAHLETWRRADGGQLSSQRPSLKFLLFFYSTSHLGVVEKKLEKIG